MATFADHVAHRRKAPAQGRGGRFRCPSSYNTLELRELCRAVMHQRENSITEFEGKTHTEQCWHEYTCMCVLFISQYPGNSACFVPPPSPAPSPHPHPPAPKEAPGPRRAAGCEDCWAGHQIGQRRL